MIRIYLDQSIVKGRHYIENDYSSADIRSMEKDDFARMIKEENNGTIYSCYDPFVNHVGRFVREYGQDWAGEGIALYAKRNMDEDYTRFYFNEKGQITNWFYGFFD